MKRSLKIAIPLLLVTVMLISALGVFIGAADADEVTEATLSTYTVTYGADGTKEYPTAFGTAKSETGDFATLAAKLSSLTPTSPTRYEITLSADVALEDAISISAGEYAEVYIKLNGYTLTTKTASDAIKVSGKGTVRILGNENSDGELGSIVYAQTSGAILSLESGSTARAVVRGLKLDLSAMTSGSAFVTKGAELVLQSAEVKTDEAISVISSEGATVELKSSVIEGAVATAISADASKIYVQDSVINTAVGIDATGVSHVLLVDDKITSPAPVKTASSFSSVYILGGRLETTGTAIVSGTYATVGLYYGSGDMKIVGDDPANYTVQDECSFAKDADGVWVMTAGKSTVGMVTKTVLGSAPVIDYVSSLACFDAVKGELGISETTVHILTLLKDATISARFYTYYGSEYFNCIVDFNGHHVKSTYAKTWNHDFYGNFNMHYDGTDAEGNRGSITLDSVNAMLLRTRVKSGESSGANDHTRVAYTNLDIITTSWTATTNPLLCLQRGELVMDNVKVRYTGDVSEITASSTFKIINAGSSGVPTGAVIRLNNVTVANESNNENVSVRVIDLSSSAKAECYANGLTAVNTDTLISAPSGTTSAFINSDVYCDGMLVNGSGAVSIYDCTVNLPAGNISNGTPTFYYGEGKNVITIGDGAELTGSYKTEDGYVLIMKEEGKFILMNAGDIVQASITMPAIFADNMVLQRNKEINIFGYCETVGATVEVTLAGKTATATVDEKGEWCATFDPMPAMFDQTIEVRQTGNTAYNLKKFTGVNIGEVWVMSGQSNGDLQTVYIEDLAEYYNLAGANKSIRMYRSSQSYSVTEKDIGSGTWYEATPENIANKTSSVTAIAYTMAVKLADELGDDVPIAVMHMVRGSCKIKTWLDYKRIQEVSPSSTREYEYWLEQNSLPSSAHGGGAVATVMYNNVIAPVYGYEVAGVLWYQGEGDTGGGYFGSTDAKFRIEGEAEDEDNTYTEFFYALEDTFREAFGNDPNLPFYVMQLSPFLSSSYDTSNVYKLKMEQYEMCKNEPNTHLVSLGLDGAIIGGSFFDGNLDPDMGGATIGGQGFIHPTRKSPVGIRTADLILANEYGIKHNDIYTYPTPVKATASGGTVTVEFDSDLRYLYGDSVMGFEIYDGSKWVKATGKIDGNKVVISAEGVTSAVSVRYGCGEMVMELGDGTLIEVWDKKNSYGTGKANYSLSSETLTIQYNGETYTVRGNTTDMIRTMDYGNITNASGVPVPLFTIDISE